MSSTNPDRSSQLEANKKKSSKVTVPSKVIMRRLPPSLTEEELKAQLAPLPAHDYFLLVHPDTSVSPWLFSRAYINFPNVSDIINFRDRFDGYVFLDSRGNEYPAVVELAPCQKVPNQRRKDVKCGTLENDYLKFLDRLKNDANVTLSSIDKTLEEIEKREKERKEAGKGGPKLKTPLIEYLEQRREEKERRREERRRQELERRKQKEEERRRRLAKEREEQRRAAREREKEREIEAEERKDADRRKPGAGAREERQADDRPDKKHDRGTRKHAQNEYGGASVSSRNSDGRGFREQRNERVFTRGNQGKEKARRRENVGAGSSAKSSEDQDNKESSHTVKGTGFPRGFAENEKGAKPRTAPSSESSSRAAPSHRGHGKAIATLTAEKESTSNPDVKSETEKKDSDTTGPTSSARRRVKPSAAIYQPRARTQAIQQQAKAKSTEYPDAAS